MHNSKTFLEHTLLAGNLTDNSAAALQYTHKKKAFSCVVSVTQSDGRWNNYTFNQVGPPPQCDFNWNVNTIRPMIIYLFIYLFIVLGSTSPYFSLFISAVRINKQISIQATNVSCCMNKMIKQISFKNNCVQIASILELLIVWNKQNGIYN